MRDLATEPQRAFKTLGSEVGQAFIAMLADLRAAPFAGELPSVPRAINRSGPRDELEWFISMECALRTTINADRDSADAWKLAHRIRLEYLEFQGEVIG